MSEKISEKEEFLIQLIRKNPYISEQDLADSLNVSQPVAANMISGLIKKGYIMGRAYVLADNNPIVCIGGANVDRKYFVKDKVELGKSNPAKSSQSVGGVARNIAENLGRLGQDVSLLTCSGTDADWKMVEESSSPYMKLDSVTPILGASTGSYTAVLDEQGELIIALADMDIYDSITPDLLKNHESLLGRSRCIISDLNIPKESIQYIIQFARSQKKPLVLVPVSSPKMKRMPEDLSGVTWLITNSDETETFFQRAIHNHHDWEQALKKWLSLGVENVVITRGKEGALIGNAQKMIHAPVNGLNAGTGDTFSSAVINTWLDGGTLEEIGKAAEVNANEYRKR